MATKPILAPLWDEWWKKGRIVATTQQKEDIKLAFHVGAFAMMGLMQKMMALDQKTAMAMGKQMQEECKHILYDRTPKVVASINGETLN